MSNQTEVDLAALLNLVDEHSRPNINRANEILRDLTAMKFNIKFFGYEIAKKLASELPVPAETSARYVGLSSKASIQADLESDWAAHWCRELKIPVTFHRKIWEFIYVLQAFYENGVLAKGMRGLGFGCGAEPIPSLLAAKGVQVTVTDLEPSDARAMGWGATNQLTTSLENVYREDLVDRSTFAENVSLKYVDMTGIPSDIRDYDFCWSICSLEHLGSIEAGLTFIENSLDTLKPGGIAVHTTEFNFLYDDEVNFDNWGTVLFQKRHFELLFSRITKAGHAMAPLNFDVGDKPMDRFIDVPPFSWDAKLWKDGQNHMKLSVDGIPSTCFGILIKKSL